MTLDYNFLAQEYAKHRRVQPKVLKNLMEVGKLTNTSRMLDVGCGTGNYTVALEKALGCSCWGIEPSEQMLTKAKERTQSSQFKIGKAEALDYPDEFFDLVFSVDVIHHVVDRAAYSLTDIQSYRDKAFSSLHLISAEAFERGIMRMEEDLKKGPIPCVSRYVLLWRTKDSKYEI